MQYVIFIALILKKSILAAIAAICLVSGALAAEQPVKPPLSDMPPEIYIAVESIQQELARRLDPGKGKLVHPEQPSAVAPTPAQKAALRAVFGSEQPLDVKHTGTAGKVAQYAVTIPAGAYQLDDTQLSWSAVALQLSVDASGASTSGKWPGIEVHGLDYNAVMRSMIFNSRQQRDSLLGSTQSQIESIVVDDLTPAGTVRADGISYRQTLGQQNKKLDQQYEVSAKRLTFAQDVLVDDFHVAVRLRGLHPATMQKLADAMKAPKDAAADQLLPAILKTLLIQGADVELSDLSASFGGGKLRVNGIIGLPGVTMKDLESRDSILDALDAKLNIEVSTSTLRAIALQFARKSSKDQNPQQIAKQAQDIYSFALGKVIAGGYATLEKDKLVSVIEIRHGKLRINHGDEEFALKDLLEKFNKPADAPGTPLEQDHSAPVAVYWRDRNIDDLQLFAVNGDTSAIRELCLRNAQTNNAEQAQRWCAKAGLPVPDKVTDADLEPAMAIKDNTLALSAEGGHYDRAYFRFDADKLRRLQLRLDKPQKHDTWAPTMTICLQAAAPSDQACISFSKYTDADAIQVSSRLYAADGKPRGETHILKRTYKPGEPIPLDIHVNEQEAIFWSGEGEEDELLEPVLFPAALISLSCSSANCSFTFD